MSESSILCFTVRYTVSSGLQDSVISGLLQAGNFLAHYLIIDKSLTFQIKQLTTDRIFHIKYFHFFPECHYETRNAMEYEIKYVLQISYRARQLIPISIPFLKANFISCLRIQLGRFLNNNIKKKHILYLEINKLYDILHVV